MKEAPRARRQAPGAKTAVDRALVDELASIEKELADADAEHSRRTLVKTGRAEALRRTILGWYDKAEASSSFVAQGKKAAYAVSARALSTTVFVDQALKVLGQAEFMKVATVPVGVLKKAAGKKYALCARSERTGLRSLRQVGV